MCIRLKGLRGYFSILRLVFTTHIYYDYTKLQTKDLHTILGDRRRPPFAPGVKVPDSANVKGKPAAVGIMNLLSMKM